MGYVRNWELGGVSNSVSTDSTATKSRRGLWSLEGFSTATLHNLQRKDQEPQWGYVIIWSLEGFQRQTPPTPPLCKSRAA